ncbi:MAG: 5'/3'-nucleotidase SurE [Rhodospirillaceae bacterium]
MYAPLTDLSQARILVSNDDGIDAPGIALLERIARTLSDDVWVVAPETEQSGAGHALTLHHPLRFRQLGDKRFSVTGTPTDCVMLAVNHFMAKAGRPDLILSGINRGGNLGDDIIYSGTVAAAMEGTLFELRAIALSQVMEEGLPALDWSPAEAMAEQVIRRACACAWPKNVMVNVNFPAKPPAEILPPEVTHQGCRKLGDEIILRSDPRDRPYLWIGPKRAEEPNIAGSDLEAVTRGAVSITPLTVDLTSRQTMSDLSKVF